MTLTEFMNLIGAAERQMLLSGQSENVIEAYLQAPRNVASQLSAGRITEAAQDVKFWASRLNKVAKTGEIVGKVRGTNTVRKVAKEIATAYTERAKQKGHLAGLQAATKKMGSSLGKLDLQRAARGMGEGVSRHARSIKDAGAEVARRMAGPSLPAPATGAGRMAATAASVGEARTPAQLATAALAGEGSLMGETVEAAGREAAEEGLETAAKTAGRSVGKNVLKMVGKGLGPALTAYFVGKEIQEGRQMVTAAKGVPVTTAHAAMRRLRREIELDERLSRFQQAAPDTFEKFKYTLAGQERPQLTRSQIMVGGRPDVDQMVDQDTMREALAAML